MKYIALLLLLACACPREDDDEPEGPVGVLVIANPTFCRWNCIELLQFDGPFEEHHCGDYFLIRGGSMRTGLVPYGHYRLTLEGDNGSQGCWWQIEVLVDRPETALEVYGALP